MLPRLATALTLVLAWACLLTAAATAQPHPPLQPYPGSTEHWGRHVQRTMGLLADSTPERRHAVKVLFYGQSIVGGKFHAWVERDLRDRFPHADLTVENKALGGYSSQYLIKTVERDVIASQPDLVVFKVGGDHILYEKIVHTIRQRTAAEVMLLSGHWGADSHKEDGSFQISDWAAFCDAFYPLVAEKYECELVDVRWPWKAYLERHGLQARDLLLDSVHLNDHGRWLMAELINRQLVHRPERMTPTSANLVRTLAIGEDLDWQDGRLTVPFTGSRVDLLRTHAGGASCVVTLDGRPPSTIPALTQHTRTTSLAEPHEWPEIMRVGFETIPPPQTWTLTIDAIDPQARRFDFSLEGSLTGPDGKGHNHADFISDSGHVTIAADDWAIVRKGNALRQGDFRPGMRVRWRTVRLGDDLLFPNGRLVRDRPMVHTLFAGLPNTPHELTLDADGLTPSYTHVRVYTPMLPDGPFKDMAISPGDARLNLQDISAPTPLD
jgi:hypothetical protein